MLCACQSPYLFFLVRACSLFSCSMLLFTGQGTNYNCLPGCLSLFRWGSKLQQLTFLGEGRGNFFLAMFNTHNDILVWKKEPATIERLQGMVMSLEVVHLHSKRRNSSEGLAEFGLSPFFLVVLSSSMFTVSFSSLGFFQLPP